MGPHDITEIINMSHEWKSVRCACGRSFVEPTEAAARRAHEGHYKIEVYVKPAREQLKGDR